MTTYIGLVRSASRKCLPATVVFVAFLSGDQAAIANWGTTAEYSIGGSARLSYTPVGSGLITVQEPISVHEAAGLVGQSSFLTAHESRNIAPADAEGARSAATADISAFADAGVLKLELIGDVEQVFSRRGQTGQARFVNISVQAGWDDNMRLSGPTVTPGEPLRINGKLLIEGSVHAMAVASDLELEPTVNWSAASVGLNLSIDATIDPGIAVPNFGTYYSFTRETTSPAQPEYQFSTASIPISILTVAGEARSVHVSALLRSEATAVSGHFIFPGQVSAFFSGDFGHTIRWGGITSVTDANTGQIINDWTVTSDSGFDYTTPYGVPEPSSILVLGTSLCAQLALRPNRCRL